ncbi:MAG: hypothetical protein WB615_13245 [Candidatus Tumulicola sp.]
MKISNSAKYVIGVFAAVALLAGCTSSGGSQLAPTGGATAPNAHQQMGSNHKVDLSLTLVTPRSVKTHLHKVPNVHLIKPNCCALQKTVFITDAFGGSSFTGAVYAFDYVTGAALGQLAAPPEGWFEVQGACSDTSGNAYFANTAESTIDEYTHSGSYVATLSDPGQYPVGCAFDKSTGNLEVQNIINTSGGPGSISIYSGGVLQNTYFPPNMFRVYFAGYMGKSGTLYVDGEDSSGAFEYDSFAGGTFTQITITGGDILFPGTVAYSGKTASMNVGDQDTFSSPTFYQVSTTGAITGSTVTNCTQFSDICDIVQGTIKGPGLVGPDASAVVANRFAYPAGGASILNYGAAYVEPIGSAVSPDKGD